MATTKIFTEDFHVKIAENFFTDINDPRENSFYLYAAEQSNNTANSIPVPNTAIQTSFYDQFQKMIFGKKIGTNDAKHMIKKNKWVSGTVYAAYDPEDPDLFSKQFYVSVIDDEANTYQVFKCLNNNGGVASTVAPAKVETSADDAFYKTSDGYQWKYMFDVSQSIYQKFETTDYMPVSEDAAVTGNAVPGAIETLKISFGGSGYNSHAQGSIKESSFGGDPTFLSLSANNLSGNTNFYNDCSVYIRSGAGYGQIRSITRYFISGGTEKIIEVNEAFSPQPDSTSSFEIAPKVAITGDGNSANGIAIINTTANSIYSVEMINKGSGYSFADVVVTGNTGRVAGNTSINANNATVRAIISPKNGHGSNVKEELGAKYIGISVSFANNETNSIPATNTFRTIGLLQNPLYANVAVTVDVPRTTFTSGETLVFYANTEGVNSTQTATKIFTYDLRNYRILGVDNTASYTVGDEFQVTNNLDGTVAIGENSKEVTGTGTDFVTDYANGDVIAIVANGTVTYTRTIDEVSNTTFLTVLTSLPVTASGLSHYLNPKAKGTITQINSPYLTVRKDTSTEIKVADTDGVATVANIAFGISGNVITGIVSDLSSNSAFSYDNTQQSLRVKINDQTISDVDTNVANVIYSANSTAVLFTFDSANDVFSASSASSGDVVTINVDTDILVKNGLQPQATGIVIGGTGNTVYLGNVSGTILTTGILTGLSSNNSGNIVSRSTDFETFDQRTEIEYTYNYRGDANTGLLADEKVSYTEGSVTANGFLHEIAQTNAGSMYLTDVKGTFISSDVSSGTYKYIIGSNSGASIYTGNISIPDLVKDSGKIIYVENFDEITRANDQTETFKLIVEF